MVLNQDDKHRLSKQFTDDYIREKAKEMGVDPSELTVRTVNGRNKLVKKSDVFSQLTKQRKLVAPKKIIRSIRGGQNSMVAQINKEIEKCRTLFDALNRLNVLDRKEQSDFNTSLSKLENRTISIEKSLTDIEIKIDETKKNDVVFDDAESVLAEMQNAKEQGDQDCLMELQTTHAGLLKEYNEHRKALLPSIHSARKYRLDLQREFWSVQQIHFRLGMIDINRIKKNITLVVQAVDGGQSQSILSDFKILHGHHGQLMAGQTKLALNYPPTHVELNEATKTLDAMLPEMIKIIDLTIDITNGLNALIDRLNELDPELLKRATQRMAYAEKKE